MGNKLVRLLTIISGLILIVALAFLIGGCHKAKPAISGGEQSTPKIVSVDEVVAHPENPKGIIGVSGTVFKSGNEGISFLLGCEDACMSMPIVYSGVAPKEGAEIIAFGEIKVGSNDRYFFLAKEIKPKS